MKINYPAVIVAAIVHWIVGGVWYGIFGSTFSAFIGPEKMKELESHGEAKAFIVAFLCSLLLAFVLAQLLRFTRAAGLVDGLQIVFLLWLGFIASTQLLTVLFEGRHPGLYLLNVGYQLVACALAGVVLVVWKPRRQAESA